MHTPSDNATAGFTLALIPTVLWGLLPIALKELVADMDATTIVWYRFVSAALVLFLYLSIKKQLPQPFKKGKKIVAILALTGLCLCANYTLFTLSLNYINAETTEVVIQLSVLLLLVGSVIIYSEPFSLGQKLGVCCMFIGMGLFFNTKLPSLFQATSNYSLGVTIIIVASVCWAIYALMQKSLLNHFSSMQILFMLYIMASILLLPLSSPAQLFQLSTVQLVLLAFCCLNTLIAYGAFAEAMEHWHASKVSAILAMSPLFTIVGIEIIVWINPDYLHTDNLNWISISGAILLVSGIIATSLVPLWMANRKSSIPKSVENVG